ncbi:MAG: tetraacyldisaccharide 4'-kinase [Chitinophagales bacterium]|nr:MAG: tetraacyldisaccharide 4'-kinase [Chitinophagales bacterium]
MTPTSLLRFLLAPFAVFYGLVVWVRNLLYDTDLLRSVEFDFPVIGVGNLSVGGSGKTPHVEYLIRLIAPHFRVGVLSRGYKRKTSGYVEAQASSMAEEVGDEPALLKRKYPFATVAVCEQRATGVPQLLMNHPALQVVILDDAFQHRSVRAGLSVLITSYSRLFTRDYILPVGALREFRSAYKRAEFIVVSKCPPDLSSEEKNRIRREINPLPGQLVFFSYLVYGKPYLFTDPTVKLEFDQYKVLLVTGIASPSEPTAFLKSKVEKVFTMQFSDHHSFDRFDMERITETFQNIEGKNKVMITTEKDAVRLLPFSEWIIEKKLPIFVLPVQVEFFEEDKRLFDSEITGWLQKLIVK